MWTLSWSSIAEAGLSPRRMLVAGSRLGVAALLLVGLSRAAVGAEPESTTGESVTTPEEPGEEPAEPAEPGDAAHGDEPSVDAEPSADVREPDEPSPPVEGGEPDEPSEPDADVAAGDDEASSNTAAPSDGALPSGQAKTDDEPVDEDLLDESRRRGRRRRRDADRDAGQWQVFAPYPELGPIRYRDPESRRTLWLGFDVSSTYLPTSFGLSSSAVWTTRPAGAWAFALTPWLALGGRHEIAWYDTQDRRIRVHGHQVELSSRPLAASRSTHALDDRLALGVTTHAIQWSDEGGTTSNPAGQQDTILHLGYGLDHLLGTRWRLGWRAQGRYAWVGSDTQRHARVSTRLAFHPRPPHRLSLDAVGYYVNRDSGVDPPRPRNSFYGQLGLGYSWVGSSGVGPWTRVRATSGFMSGEAPVYEQRTESLSAGYGEVLVGMLARWP